MSGEFILTKLREEFSKRCLIVRGIPPGTDHQSVNSIFKGQCQRIQHKAGSMWVILFHNPQQASNFIDIFPQQISQSTVFDIPDNWLQDQDDQRSSTAAMHSRNFLQGYHDNTIIFPPLNFQGQCPQNSKKNPFFHGHSKHPSAGTPSKIPVSDGPQMVPSDQNFYKSSLEPTFYMNYPNAPMSGPQVVPFDHKFNTSSFQPTIYENFPSFSMTRPHVEPYNSTSYKSSFESTVNENFPSMLMSGPVSSVPPPYENYDFAPPVPPRIPIRKSPAFQIKATKSAVQSSSIESVYKSSDDAELMRQTGEDFPLEAKLGERSSSEESINKGSDFVPIDQIVQETTSEATCSIEVSSLPPNITEEFITFFFENSKRCGGGDVENVSYDEKNNTAIITFQDPAVVRNVLKKHETTALSMNMMQLQIKDYYPETDESEDEIDVTAVKVTNLPPKISKEQIELFFENIKRSGSEEFKKVDYDEAANCAIVWFNDSKVVKNVLEKYKTSPFTMNKQKVKVEEYHPAADEVERSSEEEEKGVGAIKVTRLHPETTEEEIKELFENSKKSGGGDVEKVVYDAFAQTPVIWFKEDDDGCGKPHGHPWNPVVEDKNAFKATIIVYEESQNIDTGISRLKNSLERDFDTKEYKDEIIKKLSKTQMKALYDLKERFQIDLNIDKDKGMVFLHGTKDDISAASDVYHRIIREAERGFQDKLRAKLLFSYVQWYYVDNSDDKNELIDYPPNINLIIEKAYRNQDKEVKFTDDGGTEYAINFNNMEEYPTVDKSDVYIVTRREKSGGFYDSTFEPPSEWSAMKDSDNLVVVLVKSGSPEYSSVIDRFHAQVGKKEIVQLERIQNKMLYQQYVAKKKLLDSQNPKGTKNERELWHGTAPDAASSINSLGFNRSYCGKNATAYGEGVYFAVNAGYSASDTYSRPDNQKHKRMYLCKVLTGEFTRGQGGMRVPPAKQGQQSHILYDSVVDNVGNPTMFIIFINNQGYPDYLITFK